jgi:hypothetical protein
MAEQETKQYRICRKTRNMTGLIRVYLVFCCGFILQVYSLKVNKTILIR